MNGQLAARSMGMSLSVEISLSSIFLQLCLRGHSYAFDVDGSGASIRRAKRESANEEVGNAMN